MIATIYALPISLSLPRYAFCRADIKPPCRPSDFSRAVSMLEPLSSFSMGRRQYGFMLFIVMPFIFFPIFHRIYGRPRFYARHSKCTIRFEMLYRLEFSRLTYSIILD